MNKKEFLNLFKECIKEGEINFNFKEGEPMFGEPISGDRIEIEVEDEIVEKIYLN